jgi:hypothetical protein
MTDGSKSNCQFVEWSNAYEWPQWRINDLTD